MVLCHVALLRGVRVWAIFLEVWALGYFLSLWAMKPRALVGSQSSPQILVENSRHNFIAHVLCSPPDMYPRAERHSRQGTAQHRKLKQTKACVQAKRDENKKRGLELLLRGTCKFGLPQLLQALRMGRVTECQSNILAAGIKALASCLSGLVTASVYTADICSLLWNYL